MYRFSWVEVEAMGNSSKNPYLMWNVIQTGVGRHGKLDHGVLPTAWHVSKSTILAKHAK